MQAIGDRRTKRKRLGLVIAASWFLGFVGFGGAFVSTLLMIVGTVAFGSWAGSWAGPRAGRADRSRSVGRPSVLHAPPQTHCVVVRRLGEAARRTD